MKKEYMQQAIELAQGFQKSHSGGPFGAIIIKNGKVVGKGSNRVTVDHDPTAHAEIVAIRDACKNLNSFQLNGCEIYSSCEPCPMCLSALYWSRIDKINFAATRQEAAIAGFDDQMIYDEIPKEIENRKIPCEHIKLQNATVPFDNWLKFENKIEY